MSTHDRRQTRQIRQESEALYTLLQHDDDDDDDDDDVHHTGSE